MSALLAEYLESLSRDKVEFERLVEQQRQIVGEIEEFRAADRLGRDELHDRALR